MTGKEAIIHYSGDAQELLCAGRCCDNRCNSNQHKSGCGKNGAGRNPGH